MKHLFIFFFFISCSSIVQKEEKNLDLPLKKKTEEISYCQKKYALLASTKISLKALKKINLLPIEKFVLLSLAQFNLRPDQTAPTSHLQVYIYHKNKGNYFDFYSKNPQAKSFLFGLKYLLKKYRSRKSLKDLANLLKKVDFGPYLVGKDLSTFLKKHEKKLKEYPQFKKFYFKGTSLLRPGESLAHFPFHQIIKGDYGQVEIDQNLKDCNFDLSPYQKFNFSKSSPFYSSNEFAFKGDNFLALGVTSQVIDEVKFFNNTPVFKGQPSEVPAKFCYFKKKNIILTSSYGRDPGQFLFQIKHIDFQKIENLKDLNFLLSSPRHLYLPFPLRVLYESQKSSKKKIETILNSGIPVYYQSSIGNIWGATNFHGQLGLIKDTRSDSHLSCQN